MQSRVLNEQLIRRDCFAGLATKQMSMISRQLAAEVLTLTLTLSLVLNLVLNEVKEK